MKGTLILISLFLVVSFAHPVIEDTTDDSLETSVEIQEPESEETTGKPSNSTMTMTQHPDRPDANNTTETNLNNIKNVTSKQIDSTKQFVQPLAIHPYFYPATWSPYYFRASAFYHPYLMPVLPSFTYRSASPSHHQSQLQEEAEYMEKNPFPVDDELSEEDALKELEAIRKELAEEAAAAQHQSRLLFPSISVDPVQSSVTVSVKGFASLLRSLSSRVTVTLATRTILVPNISVLH